VTRSVAVWIGALPLLFAYATPARAQHRDARSDLAEMRVVLAKHASASLSLYTLEYEVVSESVVELEEAARIEGSIQLVRARLRGTSHGRSFLLAATTEGILRLGGFPTPELEALAAALTADTVSVRGRTRRGELLALAADEFGAQMVVFPYQPSPDGIAEGVSADWRRRQPADWPADILDGSAQGWRQRLTSLSLIQDRCWVPTVYSFEFGARGNLLAWAKREGEPLCPNPE
jgi:hypothetical protein